MAAKKRSDLENAAIRLVQLKKKKARLKRERADALKRCSVGKVWIDYLSHNEERHLTNQEAGPWTDDMSFALGETCAYKAKRESTTKLCPACVKSQKLHEEYTKTTKALTRTRTRLNAAVKKATS
jgi:hypothetical protein